MIWKEIRAHDAPPMLVDAWRRRLTIVDGLLVVSLFAILPLEHTPGLRYLLCFLLGLRGLWLLAKYRDHSSLKRFWAMGPWLVWASASYFWSVAPMMTLADLKHDLWMPMLAFLGGYQLFRHRCPPTLLLWAVAAGTITNGIVTAFGAPSSAYPFHWASYYFSTVGYSSTFALYFSALALPWTFFWGQGVRQRLLGLTIVMLNIAVALVDKNRMFFVTEAILLLALFGVALRMKRRATYIVGVAAVVLMALFIQVNQNRIGVWTGNEGIVGGLIHQAEKDTRLKIWASWAKRAAARPVLGVGFGRDVPPTTLSSAEISALLTVDTFAPMHSHNLFLNIVLETGWVGLACFLLLLGQFFRQSLRSRLTNGAALSVLLLLAAMVLKNQTDIFMLFGPAVLFYAALGILTACLRDEPFSS